MIVLLMLNFPVPMEALQYIYHKAKPFGTGSTMFEKSVTRIYIYHVS